MVADRIKRAMLIQTIIPVLCLCTGLFYPPVNANGQGASLKKLYISSITADGVSAPLAKKVRERLEFALYENFGKEYRVLTDEDVRVLFRKAAELMATGCGAETCQRQMADAVDADEIIYGELTGDGTGLRLTARTLLRDRTTLSVTKKSMVVLSFAAMDLEHYCAEAAKKLVNPAYVVRGPAKTAFDEGVRITPVTIGAEVGLDVAVMTFTTGDEAVRGILEYLKGLVKEGDDAFARKRYDEALGKYLAVIERAETKLTPQKRDALGDFMEGVGRRFDTAFAMKYKVAIGRLDAETAKLKADDEKRLRNMLARYDEMRLDIARSPYAKAFGVAEFDEMLRNPGAMRDAPPGLAEVAAALANRNDALTAALAGLRLRKGDALYAGFAFAAALDEYRAAAEDIGRIYDTSRKNELAARHAARLAATETTGKNYLLSRVRALGDRVEYFNIQGKNGDAKAALRDARALIEGDLVIFSTPAVVETFNAVARLLGEEVMTTAELERKVFIARGGGRERKLEGVVFVYIPGGSFMMGSPEGTGENDEHPAHFVTVAPFWISKYEITQSQYEAIVGNNPGRFKGGDNPVEQVSWNDAMSFCARLGERGKAAVRLPTEAEWEYACRAGSTTRYYWGDDFDEDYCWYAGNTRSANDFAPRPVGRRKPNAWGLHDMCGNVDEWCMDWYGEAYYTKSPEKNPSGPESGKGRVVRGGSSCSFIGVPYSANRFWSDPEERSRYTGFRCVIAEPLASSAGKKD